MKKSARLMIVLTVIAIISGAVLSFMNIFAEPRIQAHKQAQLERSIGIVLPGTVQYETEMIDGTTFYIGSDANGQATGVAFKAVGNGFQSKLEILVGTDLAFSKILAITFLAQAETPGLGTKIESDPTNRDDTAWFTTQFQQLTISRDISYIKNQAPTQPGEIQAITGATISSKSVVDILNQAIQANREIFLNREA